MEKLYSDIVGAPVVEDNVLHPITTVKDLILDPETGKLAAFVVDIKRNLVISPIDVLFFGNRIQIHERHAVIPGSEILRVEEIQKKNIRIFGNKVVTEDGFKLGKVVDLSIDMKDYTLKKLFVAKEILGMVRYDSRIISAKNIVEILPNKIIVKNNLETVKEKESSRAEDLAIG